VSNEEKAVRKVCSLGEQTFLGEVGVKLCLLRDGRLRGDTDRDCKTPCLDFLIQQFDELSVQLLFDCIRVSFDQIFITQ
jgi:hypothetical protein